MVPTSPDAENGGPAEMTTAAILARIIVMYTADPDDVLVKAMLTLEYEVKDIVSALITAHRDPAAKIFMSRRGGTYPTSLAPQLCR
jgi:hypothetical protein